MEYRNVKIERFENDCFRLEALGQIIYFDPYNLQENQVKLADHVLVTHGHFDHCSHNDIRKLVNADTVIVAPLECQEQLRGLKVKEVVYVAPDQKLELDGLTVATVAAYNLDKFRSPDLVYHPKDDGKVGYIIEIDNLRIYHAGDTDNIPEMERLGDIDVALLPVSGTYVMTWQEAVAAAKLIKPKLAIPMHYGSVVGSQQDAEQFKQALLSDAAAGAPQVELI